MRCPLLLRALAVLWWQGGQRVVEGKPQPHILFMLADDLGHSCVGYNAPSKSPPEIRTPNIDGLASSGLILNRHCQ